jgi:hypothetical protein
MSTPSSSSPLTIEVSVAIITVLREISRREHAACEAWAAVQESLNHAVALEEQLSRRYPTIPADAEVARLHAVVREWATDIYYRRAEVHDALVRFADAFLVGTITPDPAPDAHEGADRRRRIPNDEDKRSAKHRLKRAIDILEEDVRLTVGFAISYVLAVERAAAEAERLAAENAAREAERWLEEALASARHETLPTAWERLLGDAESGCEDEK